MKKDYFEEEVNEDMMYVFPEEQTDVDDYVNEEELLALEQEQQMIDMMEEQALLEQAEEQAVIDAYIEQQLIEQSLLDQADEEVLIEYEDQRQFDDVEPTITVPKVKHQKPSIKNTKRKDDDADDEESDVEEDSDAPLNVAAHRLVLLLMKQHNHLDIYVKKEEISISCFGITRLKYKLNDNSWIWILNYLEKGYYEDYGVDPLKVADIDCESRVKELIEQGSNIARVPFLRETETYIEICGFFRYGKLYFSIRRNDDFMNYLIEKGL